MKTSHDMGIVLKTSIFSAVFTVILFMLINYFINHSLSLFVNNQSNNPPITVDGTGTVTGQPDQSDVSFTVSKTATTLQDAQNQANTSMNKILSDLQKNRVSKNDIQTSNYSSSPNYADDGVTITNYTVSEDVDVTIHDNTLTNTVIDTVTTDGAENVSGPNLTFSDAKEQDLENQARTQAITNARVKAQSMTAAAGLHLGKLVKIAEDTPTPPYPIFHPVALMMKANGTAAQSAPTTQISTGQNSVTESVTLTYETN
jgi:uncharacterized protein YggE